MITTSKTYTYLGDPCTVVKVGEGRAEGSVLIWTLATGQIIIDENDDELEEVTPKPTGPSNTRFRAEDTLATAGSSWRLGLTVWAMILGSTGLTLGLLAWAT